MNAVITKGNIVGNGNGRFFSKRNWMAWFKPSVVIKALKFVLPVVVLTAFFPQLAAAAGTDLLQTGDADVKATIGSNSVAMKWLIAIEVVVGTVLYIATKNLKYLSGFIVVSILLAVGFRVAGF
ncbi:type IV conjugative transfer system pilin TraA [Serratia sp. S1B]|nr:type IV conjugative transfer system pilin TraA [Serratia sp. S1B]